MSVDGARRFFGDFSEHNADDNNNNNNNIGGTDRVVSGVAKDAFHGSSPSVKELLETAPDFTEEELFPGSKNSGGVMDWMGRKISAFFEAISTLVQKICSWVKGFFSKDSEKSFSSTKSENILSDKTPVDEVLPHKGNNDMPILKWKNVASQEGEPATIIGKCAVGESGKHGKLKFIYDEKKSSLVVCTSQCFFRDNELIAIIQLIRGKNLSVQTLGLYQMRALDESLLQLSDELLDDPLFKLLDESSDESSDESLLEFADELSEESLEELFDSLFEFPGECGEEDIFLTQLAANAIKKELSEIKEIKLYNLSFNELQEVFKEQDVEFDISIL